MNDASGTTSPALGKNDVLDAIDFEINHRESLLSRHGLSTWGVIAATCALLWASAVEVLKGDHNFTHVVLVMLVSNWWLSFLTSPWMKALGLLSFSSNRSQNITSHFLSAGLDEETFKWLVVQTVLMFSLAVYLGFQGFVLLSVLPSIFYAVALIFMGAGWMVMNIKLPLRTPVRPAAGKGKLYRLTRLFIPITSLIALTAIRSAWPIESTDIRLGLLLAASVLLWGTSLIILKPPTQTTNLRRLRSELAFGEIETQVARTKAIHILHGTPDEHYVTIKADETASELEQVSQLCKSINTQIRQIIPLAEKAKAADCSGPTVNAVTREFRALFRAIQANFRSLEIHKKWAMDLRIQLGSRIETAELFLNLNPEIVKADLRRLDTLFLEVQTSRQELYKAFTAVDNKQAFDFLCSIQRSAGASSKQTPYQLICKLFID